MLHLLTSDPRQKCVQAWQELLTHYPIKGNDFLFRIITDDQSLFSYYQPQSKQSSKQSNKVLYLFFWDHNGMTFKESVPMCMTVTKTYYTNILVNEPHQNTKCRIKNTNCFVLHFTVCLNMTLQQLYRNLQNVGKSVFQQKNNILRKKNT